MPIMSLAAAIMLPFSSANSPRHIMIVSLAGLSSPTPFSRVSRRGVAPSKLSLAVGSWKEAKGLLDFHIIESIRTDF